MDKKSKNVVSIFFGISGGLLIFAILYSDYIKSNEMRRIHDNLYNIEINGHVSGISQNRGTVALYLKEKPSEKFYFNNSRNYNLDPYDIDKFIKVGDSVYKKCSTMKLEIYRNGEYFYFILDESINSKN
jgi:hypothetical protein